MVKVSIEVRRGATRFVVAVQAEDTQRALSFIEERYSGADIGVKFPIAPEDFFVHDPAASRVGKVVGIEQQQPSPLAA